MKATAHNKIYSKTLIIVPEIRNDVDVSCLRNLAGMELCRGSLTSITES